MLILLFCPNGCGGLLLTTMLLGGHCSFLSIGSITAVGTLTPIPSRALGQWRAICVCVEKFKLDIWFKAGMGVTVSDF